MSCSLGFLCGARPIQLERRRLYQPWETEMKSDSDIKRDVEAELKWDPDIDSTDIGVAVKDGVVTLTGFVRSYTQKWQAERDVKRVSGVRGSQTISRFASRPPASARTRI